jgi:VWFA-related protein
MTWRAVLIAAVPATALLTGFLMAQEPSAPAAIDRPDITLDVLNVQVPVTVRDKGGRIINGLAPADFQLLDEGIPQITTLDVTAHPISLVIAIQANSTARQILPTIQKSADMYVPLVAGESGEIAILGFDHRIQVLAPFTAKPEEIKAGFAKLKAGSSPHHLDDAAMEGIRMLKNRGKDHRKVLLLISETRDQGSGVNPRDVLTEAEFANVQVFPVEMNHFINQMTTQAEPNRPKAVPPEGRAPLPMGIMQTGTTDAQTNMGNWAPIFPEIFALVKGVFIQNSLEVYSKFTGGREQDFVGLSGLEEAIAQIGEELHSQYLLTFRPTSRRGGYHEITVNVNAAANLKITTRTGYWMAQRAPVNDTKQK